MSKNFEGIAQSMCEDLPNHVTKLLSGGNEIRLYGKTFAYTRFEMPQTGELGAWQKACKSEHTQVTWFVEKGYQVVAEYRKRGIVIYKLMKPGDSYTLPLGIEYSCFMTNGAIIHSIETTKEQLPIDNDVYESDEWFTNVLQNQDITKLFEKHNVKL